MSLRHAAREMSVSVSTVRRWMLKGKLQSRIVARGRRFYYQVRVEHALQSPVASPVPADIVHHLRSQLEAKDERLAQMEQDLKRQEEHIRNLSAALSNALQRSHGAEASGNNSFEKYRWLARRRPRWWPFR
jgi:predicted site-specific integrase-resolvase